MAKLRRGLIAQFVAASDIPHIRTGAYAQVLPDGVLSGSDKFGSYKRANILRFSY